MARFFAPILLFVCLFCHRYYYYIISVILVPKTIAITTPHGVGEPTHHKT